MASKPRKGYLPNTLPSWIATWFVISGVASLYDALFCLLRPRSSPGGDLHNIFLPYGLYSNIDQLYSLEAKHAGDGLCEAQSWLNLVEISLQFTAVMLSRRKNPDAVLVGFTCQTMTLSKTVLYQLAEVCSSWRYTKHNDWTTLVLGYFLPLNFWVVLPALVLLHLGSKLRRANQQASQQENSDKRD